MDEIPKGAELVVLICVSPCLFAGAVVILVMLLSLFKPRSK